MEFDIIARDGVFNIRRPSNFAPRVHQYYGPQVGFRITPVRPVREVLQYATTTWHRFFPSASAPISMMQVSRADDSTNPVPVQIAGNNFAAAAATNEWKQSMNVFSAMRADAFASMFQQQELDRVGQPVVPAPSLQLVPAGTGATTVVNAIPAWPNASVK
jgi:hypothetical protein